MRSEPAKPPHGKHGAGRWNSGGWNGKIVKVGNSDHLKKNCIIICMVVCEIFCMGAPGEGSAAGGWKL